MAPELLEREAELAVLDGALAGLRDGRGGAVLLEGPPGIGKTALLQAALASDGNGDATVLRGHGSELESGLAFGGVRQLLGSAVLRLPDDERAALLSGPAALACPVLGVPTGAPVDRRTADPLYGLYWLTVGLSERAPLILAIDDLHWLDEESARFVAYLLRRQEELAVLVLATARAPEPGVQDTISAVQVAFPTVIRPPLLTAAAIAQVLPGQARDEAFRVTGGNPLLAVELRRSLDAAPDGAPLAQLGSTTVARLVLDRVNKVSAQAAALARSVALFPDGARLDDAATVAALDLNTAADAADGLIAVQVLAPAEPLAFLHPMMRTAIYDELGTYARRRGHAAAATLLKARSAEPEEIAAHLLAGTPAQDADNVAILRAAADRALARVAPRAAARYLERAAVEDALTGDDLVRLLIDLGTVQGQIGHPDAQATLQRAFARSRGTPHHVAAAVELTARAFHNLDHDAVRATVRATNGADANPDERLTLDLLLAESVWAKGDYGGCVALIDRMPKNLAGNTAAERMALVHEATVRMFRCEPIGTILELLRRAVGARGADALVAGVADGEALGYLVWCDALDEAQALAEERQELARETGNETLYASTQFYLGWIALRRGDLRAAEAALRLALALPASPDSNRALVTGRLVLALMMRGAFDEAAAELDAMDRIVPSETPSHWVAHAELATWRGDFAAALAPYERVRKTYADAGMKHPNLAVWMAEYADCLAGLGRLDEAIAMTGDLVELSARTGGVLGPGSHHLTLGRLTGEIEQLERAQAILDPSPYRWHAARARLELGAALRRTGQRTAAREHLLAALDYFQRNGVTHFTARARDELRLAGARPRRAAVTGVESLTPAEERIARLAADGRSNKQIAQDLFLTIKTVEVTLMRAYRKLDINSRHDLPDLFQAA